MALPDFLKNKKEQKKNKKSKGDFREKCLHLLEEIKALNEDRYNELMRTFKGQYDKVNIQKKRILGFYAQLMRELNQLRDEAGLQIKRTTRKVVNHHSIQSIVDKVQKKVDGTKDVIEKEAKKVIKKAEETAKKATKKKAAKVTKKKTEKKVAKVTKKKTEKKVAKVTKKKTEKKVAKVTKKKTEKKVAKVTKKKTEKKVAKVTKKKTEKKVAKVTKKKTEKKVAKVTKKKK